MAESNNAAEHCASFRLHLFVGWLSLNRFNFQFNDLLIDIILYMLWHFDTFHFNSNFQVLWKMYNILAIKIYFGLSVI